MGECIIVKSTWFISSREIYSMFNSSSNKILISGHKFNTNY